MRHFWFNLFIGEGEVKCELSIPSEAGTAGINLEATVVCHESVSVEEWGMIGDTWLKVREH